MTGRALAERHRREPERHVLVPAASFGRHMLATRTRRDRQHRIDVRISSSTEPQEQSYYNASKAAVHHLTQARSLPEWARVWRASERGGADLYRHPAHSFDTVKGAARCKKIWIDTTRRWSGWAKLEEIASVVHFLASDAASLLTGCDRARRRRLHLLVRSYAYCRPSNTCPVSRIVSAQGKTVQIFGKSVG